MPAQVLRTGIRAAAKKKRRNEILSSAIRLFCRQGIEGTSMEAISAEAGIGSATIYRYFPTKAELLKAAILHSWSEKTKQYLPRLQTTAYAEATGAAQLSTILDLFCSLYAYDADFLRFLQAFDHYLQSGTFPPESLSEYEELLLSLKEYATAALDKGRADGSLHFNESADEIYFSVFHAMLSTTQKLALQGDLLAMDSTVPGGHQLKIVKNLLLSGLQAAPIQSV